MKTCRLCLTEKNDDEFYKGRRQCKKCHNKYKQKRKEQKKEYYEKNKEQIKEQKKEYYEKNKEQIKEYREKNKDKIKEYYENNKEYLKEQRKEYYENNKDKIKEYYENNKEQRKEYYENNKDKINEYLKEYRKCRGCKLFQTRKKTNYLCSYCNPKTSKRQKTKEIQLKNFLEKYFNISHNKKVNLNNSCQTYFPDFLIDCATFFICIECDENAHSTYDKQCELTRMNNIIYSLGLPVVFLRFNPDKKNVKMKIKQTILKSYIDYYSDKKLTNNVIEYLFY